MLSRDTRPDVHRLAPARCNPLADGTQWKATLPIELPKAPRAVLLAGEPARLGCTHPDYAVTTTTTRGTTP